MAETPTPDAWRATLRRRVARRSRRFRGLDGRHRGTAWSTCRSTVTTTTSRKAERQQMRTLDAAGDPRRHRRSPRTACWRRASTPSRSTPCRRRSTKGTKAHGGRALPRAEGLHRGVPGDADRPALEEERAFQFVKRHVSPEEAAAVRALKLEGIGFMNESHRFYPNRELAAHVLGYTGVDNDGLAGIEATYDTVIRGKAGKVLVVRPTQSGTRSVASSGRRPPARRIELTIDERLQHDVERELAVGVARTAPKAASPSSWIRGPARSSRWRATRLQSERLRPARSRRAAQPRGRRTSTSPARPSRS